MHCTNCGAELAADAKFCTNCGRSVGQSTEETDTEVTAGWPLTTSSLATQTARAVAQTLPATTTAPSPSSPLESAPRQGRPAWLVPVLVAVSVVLLALIGGGAYLATRGGSQPSFSEQSATALRPVIVADADLSSRLGGVQSRADLEGVVNSASRDVEAITAARGAISLLGHGKESTSAQALSSALVADLRYANAVGRAARSLSPESASSAQTAGQQAGQAYQAPFRRRCTCLPLS
jgi:hypothetical protein